MISDLFISSHMTISHVWPFPMCGHFPCVAISHVMQFPICGHFPCVTISHVWPFPMLGHFPCKIYHHLTWVIHIDLSLHILNSSILSPAWVEWWSPFKFMFYSWPFILHNVRTKNSSSGETRCTDSKILLNYSHQERQSLLRWLFLIVLLL